MRLESILRFGLSILALCGALTVASPAQTFQSLASFDANDGANPYAAPTLGTDGNLYGTTRYGGAHSNGAAFRLTRSGTLTDIHNFHLRGGAIPQAGLVLGTDGSFFGATQNGGASTFGTIFKMT